jgi:osmotically-inducible protein OsmY
MIVRTVGMMALASLLAGCAFGVSTFATDGADFGVNVGRSITADRSLFNVLDDLSIKITIEHTLFDEALSFNVSVDVYQGMVMLTGSVGDAVTRKKAEKLARQVDGVRELFNEIQVTDESWVKSLPKDLFVENTLTVKLVLASGIRSVNYRCRAVNGVVYFMGMARSREELDKVIALARMNGVRKIVSHVFLTDSVVVVVPSTATNGVKPAPAALNTESKADETKAKPESNRAKKKPSPRAAAAQTTAP